MADAGCLGWLPRLLLGPSCSRLLLGNHELSAFGCSLEVVKPLGEGAFSEVALVRTSVPVGKYPPGLYALKTIVIQRENMHLVERETRSQGMAAEHPNVLGLVAHECVSTANADVVQARLLFPLCEGGTLADFLKAEGGIPTDEMLRIFSQLASAVAHCHAVGVIHRDIKLTNVYRDGEGRWLLADFGSALSSTATIELDTREALALARHEERASPPHCLLWHSTSHGTTYRGACLP